MSAKRAPSIIQIFNSFAKKAVKDFPQLKNKFLIYSPVTKSWHGHARIAKEEADILTCPITLHQMEQSGAVAFTDSSPRAHIITYLDPQVKPQSRCMTTGGERHEKEIRGVLEHELGHIVAPCGIDIRRGENFRECVADAYSFIRQQQQRRDALKSLDGAIWHNTINFIFENESVHFTTPVLIELKALSKRHDLSKLTPVEAANLAYRLSLKYAYKPAQLRTLKKAFEPYRKKIASGGGVSMKIIFRIMADKKYKKHSEAVHQTGLSFLQPFFDERIDVLSIGMTRKKAKKGNKKLTGQFWNNARKKIAQHANQNQINPLLRQLDDAELLGKFDPQKPGLIDPKFYESKANQKRLQKNRLASVGL